MIDVNDVKNLMPSRRMGTILEEVEQLITEAASKDETKCLIPEGFFGKGVEQEIIYNANPNALFSKVKESLVTNGFKLGRKDLKFYISWDHV